MRHLLVPVLLTLACAREGFERVEILTVPQSAGWASYTEQLDLPDCARADEVLIVDTAQWDLQDSAIGDPSEAGDSLSFPEAIWIAANRPGPDTIEFDRLVFAPDADIVISSDNTVALPSVVPELCIDGTGRTVVIDGSEWTPSIEFESNSLIKGLTLIYMQPGIRLTNSRMAGCRYETDGTNSLSAPSSSQLVLGIGAVLGPSNVIGTVGDWGVQVSTSAEPRLIVGNFFSFDPLTRQIVGPGAGVETYGAVIIEGNVFACIGDPMHPRGVYALPGVVTIRHNYIGVTERLEPLPGGIAGLRALHRGTFVVGPGNVISGTGDGYFTDSIEIWGDNADCSLPSSTRVHITRNRIFDNSGRIRPSCAIAAPEIGMVGDDVIRGTCELHGMVEVFADRGDEGHTFLASAYCDGSWALQTALPSGWNVTATLTLPGMTTSGFSAPHPVP